MDDNLIERRRPTFEAWVSGRKVVKKYGAKLTLNADGSYADYRINDRWLAWNAALDSAVVELPRQSAADDLMFISDARSRIERAGLRVKS